MLRKLSISTALLIAGVFFLFPVFYSVQAAPALFTELGRAPVTANQVHVLYFYASECTQCKAVYEEVLTPLKEKYGDQLDLRMLETSIPENYELLIATEAYFKVKPEERALLVIVVGEQILISEEPARTNLASLLEEGIANGGITWPAIPDFNPDALQNGTPEFTEDDECTLTDPSACETGQPIYAAHFYQVGCQACSRVDADFKYLQSKYPNLIIEEFDIYDQAALADWMSARAGRDDFHTPALFIGDQAWIGEEEIAPDTLLQRQDFTLYPTTM